MAITTAKHGNFLTQIERNMVLFPVNCYLVQEDDGLTVVDTGWTNTANAILEAARTLDAPIRRIALTHAHGDHIGSLDDLKQALPEVEVVLSVRESRLLNRDFSLDPSEPQSKPTGSWPAIATRATRTIQPGDMVGSLRVIASPGHTPGHISFLDTRDGTLIAGDAFFTFTGLGVAGTFRVRFPFSAMATWDKSTALRSDCELATLDPTRLATGHGPVMESPTAAMRQAIEEAARRFGVADVAA